MCWGVLCLGGRGIGGILLRGKVALGGRGPLGGKGFGGKGPRPSVSQLFERLKWIRIQNIASQKIPRLPDFYYQQNVI